MENKKNNLIYKFLPIVLAASALGIGLLFYLFLLIIKGDFIISPLGTALPSFPEVVEKPLDRYTILNLKKYQAKDSQVIREKVLEESKQYSSYLISFIFSGKKVTGMMNVPFGDGPFPVIVMFRGYVDPENYKTGIGTEKAAAVFAQNGFITLSPDFLGYGESDREAENIFESRFQTYTVALEALSSIKNIKEADPEKMGIWGHSNGGQIALTVLETTQKEYPTVLWAPVTKPFPYSVLYYTDEAEDRGKFLRRELAKFESEYDVDRYSLTSYLERIKAPIELHQGGSDEAVPKKWSDEFNKKLEEIGVDVTYYVYPGADHNLIPSWNLVVQRNIEFYNNHFRQK